MAPFLIRKRQPKGWRFRFFLVLCIFAYLFNYAAIVYSNIHNNLSYVPRFIMFFLYKFTFRADFYTNLC